MAGPSLAACKFRNAARASERRRRSLSDSRVEHRRPTVADAVHQNTGGPDRDPVAGDRREELRHIVKLQLGREPRLHRLGVGADYRHAVVQACGVSRDDRHGAGSSTSSTRTRLRRPAKANQPPSSTWWWNGAGFEPLRCCTACIHAYHPSAGIKTRPSGLAASERHSFDDSTLSQRALIHCGLSLMLFAHPGTSDQRVVARDVLLSRALNDRHLLGRGHVVATDRILHRVLDRGGSEDVVEPHSVVRGAIAAAQ